MAAYGKKERNRERRKSVIQDMIIPIIPSSDPTLYSKKERNRQRRKSVIHDVLPLHKIVVMESTLDEDHQARVSAAVYESYYGVSENQLGAGISVM